MGQQHVIEHPRKGFADTETVVVPGYAWVILTVAYIASVAAPLNQFKVPPVMPVLIEAFNLNLGSAGMLMSIFAITGIFLALPAGFILQRLGLKVTGLIAMGALVIGSTLGALASTATGMLVSRLIEGVGMGLIIVQAPASIAMWFPQQKQGMAMGIWATCVPMGSVLMFLLAPQLANSFGWQSIWWFGAAFALLAFALVWIFMRMPPQKEEPPAAAGEAQPRAALSLRSALAKPSIWLLGLLFGCFNFVLISLNTFLPTFLSSVRNYSIAEASFTTSLVMIAVIFSAPLAGVVLDKIGSRKLLFTLPLIVMAIILPFPFVVTGVLLLGWMILLGVIAGSVPTASFSAAPEIMGGPQLAGMGMAVLTLGQNLGMFVGPVIFGSLVESSGWITAGMWMIPVMLLGLAAGWFVKVR